MAFNATSYLRLLQALLPKGWAWNRDNDSVLTEVLQAQADELARVDQRSENLLAERDTRLTSELLVEHETDLGLPDTCSDENETIQERRRIAHAKLITLGQQNPAYFIELATAFGWTVTVTEYTPFWCGLGDSGDPCGDQETIFYWKVTIDYGGIDIVYFLSGNSESGDSLAVIPGTESLMCMLSKYKPGHTTLIFDYIGPDYSTAYGPGYYSIMPGETGYLEGHFGLGFGLDFYSILLGGQDYSKGHFGMAFGPGFDIGFVVGYGGAFDGNAYGNGFNQPAY